MSVYLVTSLVPIIRYRLEPHALYISPPTDCEHSKRNVCRTMQRPLYENETYCIHASACFFKFIHVVYVTVSENTDHLAPMQFVQYGPRALQRSRSRDFAISMPRCSTAS